MDISKLHFVKIKMQFQISTNVLWLSVGMVFHLGLVTMGLLISEMGVFHSKNTADIQNAHS